MTEKNASLGHQVGVSFLPIEQTRNIYNERDYVLVPIDGDVIGYKIYERRRVYYQHLKHTSCPYTGRLSQVELQGGAMVSPILPPLRIRAGAASVFACKFDENSNKFIKGCIQNIEHNEEDLYWGLCCLVGGIGGQGVALGVLDHLEETEISFQASEEGNLVGGYWMNDCNEATLVYTTFKLGKSGGFSSARRIWFEGGYEGAKQAIWNDIQAKVYRVGADIILPVIWPRVICSATGGALVPRPDGQGPIRAVRRLPFNNPLGDAPTLEEIAQALYAGDLIKYRNMPKDHALRSNTIARYAAVTRKNDDTFIGWWTIVFVNDYGDMWPMTLPTDFSGKEVVWLYSVPTLLHKGRLKVKG